MDHSMEDTGDGPVDEHMAQKIINEEYKIWKKNSIFLYDFLLSQALEWPSLTIQWLPDARHAPGSKFTEYRMLLGTHTSGVAENFLQIAQVKVPSKPKLDASQYDAERGELGGYGAGSGETINFSIIQKIKHPGEVNKARYMPQNPNVVATMAVDGRILIFDRSKHTSIPPAGDPRPDMELVGHEKEGYGLDWSPHQEGQLLTASEDNTVRLWDINAGYRKPPPGQSAIVKSEKVWRHHSAVVNDVQWHWLKHKVFASVSDDKTIQMFDYRADEKSQPLRVIDNAHADAINAFRWHPRQQYLFATASHDKTIGLWDLRWTKKKLTSLEGHKDGVMTIDWHPRDDRILASSGKDRRIIYWDINRCGAEQTPEDAEDGPPEMLFMHGGHTTAVTEFSWNKNDPWVMASLAEDNMLMVFKAASRLVNPPQTEDIPNKEIGQ